MSPPCGRPATPSPHHPPCLRPPASDWVCPRAPPPPLPFANTLQTSPAPPPHPTLSVTALPTHTTTTQHPPSAACCQISICPPRRAPMPPKRTQCRHAPLPRAAMPCASSAPPRLPLLLPAVGPPMAASSVAVPFLLPRPLLSCASPRSLTPVATDRLHPPSLHCKRAPPLPGLCPPPWKHSLHPLETPTPAA